MALHGRWIAGRLQLFDGASTAVGNGGIDFGNVTGAALLHGGGTSALPLTTATADKNFMGYWVRSNATSGDARGLYVRLYLGGAGGGEAVRAYATAAASGVATGATINGLHASLSINASASVSGNGNAARFTLDAAADTRTLGGTLSAVQLDSNIAAGNTVPAGVAFLHVTDTGAVRIGSLLNMPNVSNGTIFAAHTTQVLTHSIKIVTADGTPYYIMCTDAATNRS